LYKENEVFKSNFVSQLGEQHCPQVTDTKWGSSNRNNDPIRGIQQLDRSLIAMHT